MKRPSFKTIKQENLKTLSKNTILKYIKGHNSVTNTPKMTANNPNLHLVNIDAFILKYGEILTICSQAIQRKRYSGVNQGP